MRSDKQVSFFAKMAYARLCEVPVGRVTTYRDLALAVGSRAYRAVGQVLRNNLDAPMVPCHRVVASDGTIGGFMGERVGLAVEKKIALLEGEGVVVEMGKIKEFENRRFDFCECKVD